MGGSFNTVCHWWAVGWAVLILYVAGGQLSTVGSCHGGQLSPVGSCHGGQLSGGDMSPGAVVGWADVGASNICLTILSDV